MKNQTFGIEIETTGIGRQRTAEAIAAHFGTTARYVGHHLGDWKVSMPDGREWTVEKDSSVTDPCAEVVSPVCTWDDLEMVQEVARVIRRAGGRADSSCGIHVHVGLGGHDAKTLRNLVNLVNANEDLLTKALEITRARRGQWCRPVEPGFLEKLNAVKPKTLEDFAAIWYAECSPDGSYRNWQRLAQDHYERSRYHLLNLHAAFSTERPAHTIEFRAFNGTLHAGKIKAYVQLCLALSNRAEHIATASPRRPQTTNPAYTFRCLLLRLGMNGEEFATARHHLMEHMEGNCAWAHGDPTTRRAN